jgi:hypothetical protein
MQAFYRPTRPRWKVIPEGRPIERVNLGHGFGVRRFRRTVKKKMSPSFAGKSILVAGAAGDIGRALVVPSVIR